MTESVVDVDLDFVFLDSNGDPIRVRKFGGDYWLHYRTAGMTWATLRKVESCSVLWYCEQACIPWEHADIYAYGIPFRRDGKGWPSHRPIPFND